MDGWYGDFAVWRWITGGLALVVSVAVLLLAVRRSGTRERGSLMLAGALSLPSARSVGASTAKASFHLFNVGWWAQMFFDNLKLPYLLTPQSRSPSLTLA